MARSFPARAAPPAASAGDALCGASDAGPPDPRYGRRASPPSRYDVRCAPDPCGDHALSAPPRAAPGGHPRYAPVPPDGVRTPGPAPAPGREVRRAAPSAACTRPSTAGRDAARRGAGRSPPPHGHRAMPTIPARAGAGPRQSGRSQVRCSPAPRAAREGGVSSCVHDARRRGHPAGAPAHRRWPCTHGLPVRGRQGRWRVATWRFPPEASGDCTHAGGPPAQAGLNICRTPRSSSFTLNGLGSNDMPCPRNSLRTAALSV